MKDRRARARARKDGSEGVRTLEEAGPWPLGNRVWRQRRVAAGGGCTYEN